MTLLAEPCPFCGEPGVLVERLIFSMIPDGKRKYRYYIECQNPACKLRPYTEDYSNINRSKEVAIQCAIFEWRTIIEKVEKAQQIEWMGDI